MIFEKLQELGIDLKGRTRGQFKTTCPKCSDGRKHKNEPCLSVNIDEGTYMCHNPGCEWNDGGGVYEKANKTYVLPKANMNPLSPKTLDWFKARGISEDTILQWSITESKYYFPQVQQERTAINFNYHRDGKLINIKYRDSQKNFGLSKGSELIFYGLDKIDGQSGCAIVEGEMDALSYYESGFLPVCSVPNGATLTGSRLDYVDNSIEAFKDKETIFLATDNDEPGIALRNELARRFGRHRCKWIDFGDCKDANEYLTKYGKEALFRTISEAKPFPVEGIITVKNFEERIDHVFKHGFPKGMTVGHEAFDRHLRYLGGQWTLIVAYPYHGKSEVLDQITTSLAYRHNVSGGVFSSESLPYEYHFTKLAEKYLMKRWQNINAAELKRAKEWINEYFHWINIQQRDLDLDRILERYENLVANKGCKWFSLDPWNQIAHQFTNETQYINKALTKITNFVQSTDSHLFLVAHPTKPQKLKDGTVVPPKISDAAGSMNFANQTFNGFTVNRDFENNTTTIDVQKVKFKFLGGHGQVPLQWNGDLGGSYWKLDNGIKAEQQSILLPYAEKDDDQLPF